MSSSFANITRRLDITPATVDTTYDKTRSISRAIKKLAYTFVVPATYEELAAPIAVEGCLVQQFNFTAPNYFRLMQHNINLTLPISLHLPLVTVKFRVGTVVTRYILRDTLNGSAVYNNRKVQAPLYNQEVIAPNFVIEFWSQKNNYTPSIFGSKINTADSTFTTNLLEIPTSVDELSSPIELSSRLSRAELAVALPEALPTVYPATNNWLNN